MSITNNLTYING